jgi:hypothetical protein
MGAGLGKSNLQDRREHACGLSLRVYVAQVNKFINFGRIQGEKNDIKSRNYERDHKKIHN